MFPKPLSLPPPPPLPPSIIHRIRVPYTANPCPKQEENTPGLHNEMVKVAVPKNKDAFLINGTTYKHIYDKITRLYHNRAPNYGNMVCDTITILTKPNTRCNLYFQSGKNENEDPKCDFYLIGSFISPSDPLTLTVQCPYTDSRQRTNALIFNWFDNDEFSGYVIPKIIKSDDFMLPAANQTCPFLELTPWGSFYIEGIQDNIEFHMTFQLPPYSYRSHEDFYSNEYIAVRPRKVKKHRHRRVLGEPGEIQWVDPSEDYTDYEWPDDFDPIINALTT